MSLAALSYVTRHSPFTGAKFSVHLAIADSVNDEHAHEFWMAVGKVARKARVTRSVASKAIAELEGKGFLKCLERNRNTPSRYQFLRPAIPMVYDPEAKGGVPEPGVRSEHIEDPGVSREHTTTEAPGGSTEHSEVCDSSETGVRSARTIPKNQRKREPKVKSLALATRPRDEIWDVLVELYGQAPKANGRGGWGSAVSQLRADEATPVTIRAWVNTFRHSDKDWAVATVNALAKHYHRLGPSPGAKYGRESAIDGARQVLAEGGDPAMLAAVLTGKKVGDGTNGSARPAHEAPKGLPQRQT